MEDRFSRTALLDGVGLDGVFKLKNSSVFVVGCGGLGSHILLNLASIGVGRIGFCDFDFVEFSNLQRQILYRECDIGLKKIDVAKSVLSSLNSKSLFEGFFCKNISQDISSSYQILVDATDSFDSRVLTNRIALKSKKPFFTGAATGFFGNVMQFFGSPCYECIFGSVDIKSVKTSSEIGIFPSLVSTIGSLISSQILKYILGYNVSFDEMISYDSLENRFRKSTILHDSLCRICTK